MTSGRGRLRALASRVLRGREGGLRDRLRALVRKWDGEAPIARASRPPPPQGLEPSPAPDADAPPAGYAYACEASELRPGEVTEVMVGSEPVALANVEGAFYAVTDICPHAGGPLGDGTLEGSTLTCPFHGWSFDVRTGECHVDPSLALDTFGVRVERGKVFVSVSGGAAAD